MRRICAWLGGAVLLAAVSPFLWAGYHWYAGQAALKRYHSAEAREHLNACLKVWPWSRSVRVHLRAARAARRAGDFQAADRLIRACRTPQGDTSPETALEWAMLHAAGGDLDEVEGNLKDRAGKDPEQAPLILEALIEGYLRLARIFDAVRAADLWLAREPDNVQALYLRGNIHRQAGASPQAAQDYRRVVELDPDRHEARWWLCLALVDIGRYEEASHHLEIIRQRQPDDVDVMVQLAICRHRLGQPREARSLLDAVLARQPDHGLALRTRGQMAFVDGNLPEAEKWLRLAVRVLPYDYKANFFLTECLQKEEGKTDEADAQRVRTEKLKDRRQRQSEIMTHLMSQRPNDPALQCELGTLLIQLGEAEVGESWLRNALRLDENYVPALEALADLYKQRGEADKAEAYRREAQTAKNHESHQSHK